MEFYQILELIMKERDLSIPDVAKMCNLTDSTIRSIIDRKQKKVALNIAFKLSDGLGVSLHQLNGEPEKKKIESVSHTGAEQKIISKYRALDEHGKDIVDTVLEKEYARVQSIARNEQDYSREIITLAANADKAEPGYLNDKIPAILDALDELDKKE